MTDQIPAPRAIPADKVQAVADWLWQEEMANGGLDEEIAPQLAARAQMCWEARAKLQALLRPTLADMTEDERVACKWMQADVAGRDTRYVITSPYDEDDDVVLISDVGGVVCADPARVTPRPDLPRLEWPGDTPAPTPATLTEGSEWGDIDALTTACRESGRDQITVIDCEGDVSVWNGVAGWWQTGTPSDGYEPYTILHTGKKADQ